MKSLKYILLITMLIAGCKKPYNPPVINSPNSYLVVEGVINSGSDSTIIKLSRTVNLSSNNVVNPVLGAALTVESDQNGTYPLMETTNGNYVSPGLNLDASHKYRLRIKTSDNKEYVSDFGAVQITPPVDSVGFIVTNQGIQLYVNTHDPQNNTHYYRFDYKETWRFHSKYPSSYIARNDSIVIRSSAEDIFTCFANNASTTILLGSSAKLQQDVIFQNPLTSVESTSEKIEDEYSILVHEYALTSDAYKFWQNLKKNTEQLGSIFDAEPSEIAGNIHNVNNAAEPVIGYISVNTVQSKRIFINNAQLPPTWLTNYPADCMLDSVKNANAAVLLSTPPQEIPVGSFGTPFTILGYLSSSPICVDCTLRGFKKQPDFWK